jgi:type I restriction enzyme S subunit
MGQSPPGSELNERGDGLPFFQGSADFNTVFPSFRVYCPTPRRTANEDDVLFSVRAPVGDCNIAKGECGIGRGLCAIRSKFASAGITYPWMKSITSDLQRASGEGVVFSSLSKAQLANCPVVVAPENVYKAADLILSPILQLMANLDEESISFESTRDTILPRLISGKLRTQAGEAEEDVADLSQETHE